jgi:hypothetical protein
MQTAVAFRSARIVLSKRTLTTSASQYQDRTQTWLNSLIIGRNLCPFAAKPQKEGTVRISVSSASDDDALLADVVTEIELLTATSSKDGFIKPTTTLIVVPSPTYLVDSYRAQIQ